MSEEFYNYTAVDDDHVDDHVDEEIKSYLSHERKSFFTFAGAGSGKTSSLIKALNFIAESQGEQLRTYQKYVAIITYTNAACDEIVRRANFNPIFKVATIHSFLWELISNYQFDIKEWVINDLNNENEKLRNELANSRITAKGRTDRETKIKKNSDRLIKIQTIKRFSYNPNGENLGYDSLNHSQVIKMGSEFIEKKETMQKVLVCKYPIILIDESQDTKKELVDALLNVYKALKDKVVIGMFGDMMQRIYLDGKENLPEIIPDTWAQPNKIMNHRSGKRIVELANNIRKDIDGKKQKPRSDADEGIIRLFITDYSNSKIEFENTVYKKMADITKDDKWLVMEERKSLILEHHMAANRFGFLELFTPLYEVSEFDTSLRDGTLPELSFLVNVIMPLIKAYNDEQQFVIATIIRKHSPLLSKKILLSHPDKQRAQLEKAEKAVESLSSLWGKGKIPTCLEVYTELNRSRLFELPSRIKDVLNESENSLENKTIIALKKALNAPFTQVENYSLYVSGESSFDTHQGVKGLEFERVAVIMDDEEARGFLFSYDKLFGAKEKSETDIKNEVAGKDTSINRTKRLFYVACTRAQKSLAVITYTQNRNAVKETAISNGWFGKDEIEII